jgi:hypothetical protein
MSDEDLKLNYPLIGLVIGAVAFAGYALATRPRPPEPVVPPPSARTSAAPVRLPVGPIHVPPVTSVRSHRLQRFKVTGGEVAVAARAYGAIADVLDRDRFEMRTARCWAEADYHFCALCSSGPRRELGATLVKCDKARCYWPLDVSEYERVGWYGEPECLVSEGGE